MKLSGLASIFFYSYSRQSFVICTIKIINFCVGRNDHRCYLDYHNLDRDDHRCYFDGHNYDRDDHQCDFDDHN